MTFNQVGSPEISGQMYVSPPCVLEQPLPSVISRHSARPGLLRLARGSRTFRPTPTLVQACHGAETQHKQKSAGTCSCVAGCGQFPDHALLSWARCTGLHADHAQRSILVLPLPAVQGGASEVTWAWRLPGVFKTSSNPPVPSKMHGKSTGREDACYPCTPELLVQEELQRRGGWAQPARPCTYLLSARSVLLPTSIMITSLPLSVLTSSIHLEVCWKELRSGGGKGG